MNTEINQIRNVADMRQEEMLKELIAFLSIPSISALSEHRNDMMRAANWIAKKLESFGSSDLKIHPTDGHPIICGRLQSSVMSDSIKILVYGHYDVQPIDPIGEWLSPPFSPTIRGENIYARGSTDMKAQLVAFFEAITAIQKAANLPVDLIFLIEGEEEVGSPNLESFINENQDYLQADFCLNLDAGILAMDTPSIMIGLRGLAYFELWLQGPANDLHSGKFGGAIENPAMVLSKLLAGMIDSQGKILLPGFYDNVREISQNERDEIAQLPQTDSWWLKASGAKALPTSHIWSPSERATARPTLEINGLLSGFTGNGSKTVLPARAMAKLSMRLVPDQTPGEMKDRLKKYIDTHLPPTVTYKLIEMHGAKPALLDRNFFAVQAARNALQNVWEKAPMFTRDGGTVPVVNLIKEKLGIETLLFGFGLPDDNPHGPNEKQNIPTLRKGIQAYINLIFELNKYSNSKK